MSEWAKQIPKEDLLALHYALCLAARHPYLDGVDESHLEKFTRLTNVCWNEHCRRLEEPLAILLMK